MALAVLAASDTDDEARKGEKRPGAFRTISEVAEDVGVHQHVLRFWESRFAQIRPLKRAGGRRFYRPDDIDLIKGVQHLLHGHGYTIKGAQRVLKDNGVRFVQAIGRGEAEAGKPSVQDQEPDGDAELIEAASDIDTVLRDVISELQACREALGSLRHDL